MHIEFPSTSLLLLGGFELRINGSPVDVSAPGRRLIAFLALNPKPLSRAFVAGALWPETTDAKAGANLRTTLWRLHALDRSVVHAGQHTIELEPEIEVDVHQILTLSTALAAGDTEIDLLAVDPTLMAKDLLPELWDSWLVFERERVRQLTLHALELLSRRLSDASHHGAAVLAALAAVEAEPLRETANRTLVDAHLAEGNIAEAVRQYRRFAELLHRELGAEPHTSFRNAVAASVTER